MTTALPGQTEVVPAGVRRFGYVLAIALSVGVLFIINNLPEGDRIPFLTNDVDQLLPIINALLLTSIVIHGVWILYDAAWFHSVGRITSECAHHCLGCPHLSSLPVRLFGL